ncbi:heme ABC transporter ATP-binding protein [Halioglobus maricola]|uniref:Heme ABC transporter ATP-binding protein n=1 Tax=Halioglobus maricola TaxID=2601894 RepID=A0A5P9NL17_9GAMM|nr:heme ABC transporter ATP-binding protein [Halioglobus maricola]QFU75638.1 heme ABC transporter ATP-binding protein [Halioglobus maricola]
MALLSLNTAGVSPYGNSELLQEIQLDLAAAEVLGIVGPNGAGKSTLLHTLAGGHALDNGELRLQGQALASMNNEQRAQSLAFLSQNPGLNFPFTVEEVILLGRIPHASGIEADAEILNQVLAFTDTESLRERLYTELSGGERQRVQLARCVAQIWRPEDSAGRVLLMDEPSAALDLAHTHMVSDIVRRLSNEGCGIIIASHDFNLLAGICDRITVLNNGRQHATGTPREVLTTPMFSDVFTANVLIEEHPVHGGPLVINS